MTHSSVEIIIARGSKAIQPIHLFYTKTTVDRNVSLLVTYNYFTAPTEITHWVGGRVGRCLNG